VNPWARMLGVMLGLSVLVPALPAHAQDREQALIAEGQRVFSAKGCSDCHAAGSSRGSDLSHIGAKKSRSVLETWVRNPVVLIDPASKPTPHMPRLNLTAKEAHALAAYLSTLK
jgi:mono/diheme cytochrome c family protein